MNPRNVSCTAFNGPCNFLPVYFFHPLLYGAESVRNFYQNGIQHADILERFFWGVTRDYGRKWLPFLIQYGGQMTMDQPMPPTLFNPQMLY